MKLVRIASIRGIRSLEELSFAERRELFRIGLTDRCAKKRVARYDMIINLLAVPQSLQQISRKIHLNPKYAKRHLNKLLEVGIIKKAGSRYLRI